MIEKIYVLEFGNLWDVGLILGIFTEDKRDFILSHPIFRYEEFKRKDENENGSLYYEGEEIWISLKLYDINSFLSPIFTFNRNLTHYLMENT